MVNYFCYNGKYSYEYGLIVSGIKTFGSPQRKVEVLHVAGRNGDILFDEGTYDNIYVSYDVYITDNFKTKARDIRGWLLSSGGYHRLTDSYNTSYYRQATYFNSLDYDVIDHLMTQGQATITFYAMPQRFLTSGSSSTSFSTSGSITNPTQFPSRPLIRAYSTGSMTINGYTITISSINAYVDIDCDTMQCYKGTTNCNGNVTIDEYPVLKSGSNTITLTSVSSIDITPRWWTL